MKFGIIYSVTEIRRMSNKIMTSYYEDDRNVSYKTQFRLSISLNASINKILNKSNNVTPLMEIQIHHETLMKRCTSLKIKFESDYASSLMTL
jgi:hypothetical protein